MKNIGRIFKYNPWINDIHTKYMYRIDLNFNETWRTVIWMRQHIKGKIYDERRSMINIDNNNIQK